MRVMSPYLLFALALLLGQTKLAQAAPINVVDFANPNAVDPSSQWNLGFQFHVNSNISITALGVLDLGLNGFAQPQQVGLWTNGGNVPGAGTLLASTFVS